MIKIGNVEINGQVCLAPMAGVSNPAYIKICEEMGCAYAITELISAEAIVRHNKKTLDMLNGYDMVTIPVALQLFGSNPNTMAKAAKYIADNYDFKVIDVNMGCPVPKVAVRSEAGSALLKNPEKIKQIITKMVSTVDVPITAKIRSGWDHNSINAARVAKICEEAGAKAITIHGRTRADGYTGHVDLDIIKAVKENVSIPVFGNGDVKSYKDFIKMLDYTKCDGVMIGRACLGNPWLIKECALKNKVDITSKDRIDMIKKHFDYLLKIKPECVALLEIRTHAAWYLKGIPGSKEMKLEIFKTKTKEEFLDILNRFEG